uniref:Uncharacterized protein n=1 Tax=Physcomitrium patens TaxID=3218 RepID=A0A7I4CZX1_PHYPA
MATSMLLQTYPCSEEQIPAPQPVRYRAPWWSAKVRGLVDMAMKR